VLSDGGLQGYFESGLAAWGAVCLLNWRRLRGIKITGFCLEGLRDTDSALTFWILRGWLPSS
jgi:hypothetical protein